MDFVIEPLSVGRLRYIKYLFKHTYVTLVVVICDLSFDSFTCKWRTCFIVTNLEQGNKI